VVRFLEAFEQGQDLDQALAGVFNTTPEKLDGELDTFVRDLLRELRLEPRWNRGVTFQRRFRLKRKPPEPSAERIEWQNEWCRVAWGSYWAAQNVDAEEALRLAALGGELPPKGLFLRGEMLLKERKIAAAQKVLLRGFELGGEDFRARMAAASIALGSQDEEAAEAHLLAAERDFPGYDDKVFSAELKLAQLYTRQGRPEQAAEARLRWLSFNAGAYDARVSVAGWLSEAGRDREAVELWQGANEVDPFRRAMHLGWGRSLRALGRHAEALREFEVGLLIPIELDGDLPKQGGPHPKLGSAPEAGIDFPEPEAGAGAQPMPADPAALWRGLESVLEGYRALTLVDLERPEEAREAVARALSLDSSCPQALEARGRLGE